jgi:hypothetical protein
MAVWMAATAAAAAVTVALYARDLSQPHADFTAAVWALLATLFGLLRTYNAGTLRRHLMKIDRAAQAAGVRGGTASVGVEWSSEMAARSDVQQ